MVDPDDKKTDVDKELKERFKQLPKVIQDAILSADVEKRLRALADSKQLHLDQWGSLENEVQLTLMGFQEPEDLAKNIEANVGVTAEMASQLAQEINTAVFLPIREELERGLGSPDAKIQEVSEVDKMRDAVLKQDGVNPATINVAKDASRSTPSAMDPTQPPIAESAQQTPPAPQAIVPGTPPAPPPTAKAVRAPLSDTYHAKNPSTERKVVDGDPYREQIS